MKRIMMLACLMALVLGFAATASAVELQMSGQLNTQASWLNNGDFDDELTDRDFTIFTRLRYQFDFIANENLRAVLQNEIGHIEWGDANSYMGVDPVAIEVRRLFLDFNWPGTEVNIRGGLMPVSLPAAFGGGNIAMDEEAMALTVGGAFNDTVGFLAGYTRLYNQGSGTATYVTDDHLDAWFAALPLTFDGLSLTPYALYGYTGGNTLADMANTGFGNAPASSFAGILAPNATAAARGQDATLWYGGLAFEMDMFDPFVLRADLMYGAAGLDNNMSDRSGWYGDIALEYTGWDMVTPELFFVYSSGEDGNSTHGDGGSERMPILSGQNYGLGGFVIGGDWYNDGQHAWNDNFMGFWALGLSLKDISFFEGLSHNLHLVYLNGTNDSNLANEDASGSGYNVAYGTTLLENDNIFFVTLQNEYAIYEELTAHVDFGYAWVNLDEEDWEAGQYRAAAQSSGGDDAFKFTVGLGYNF